MKKIIPIILTLILLITCAFAVDNSGANAPELYQGLYPIKYDSNGDVSFTSALDPEWYNYTEGRWANAVTLDKVGQMNPSTATVDNITGYYVWIPRYAYLIRTGYNTADMGRIDIRFLNGVTNKDKEGNVYYTVDDLNNKSESWESINTVTYIGDRQMEYLVHPAFNFEEELTGIWVGKYEASKTMIEDITRLNTIPNVALWQGIDVGSSFEATRDMTTKSENYDKYNLYGLGENINTHLIKANEYGAVVYLANSIYGNNSADNYYKVEKIDDGKEYIAGYLEGTTGLGNLGSLDEKYKYIYTKDEEGNIIKEKGTAYLETSDGINAWGNGTITNIDEANGLIVKENAYGVVASDGQATDVGFRVVITKGTNESKIKEVYEDNDSYWWIMENGDVWVMGNNTNGKLGLGDEAYRYIPEKLEVDSEGNKVAKIRKVVSKSYSTFYIAENGSVYVTGKNNNGQLGVGGYNDVSIATKLKFDVDNVALLNIIDVVTDGNHTNFLGPNGELYVSGQNYNGLGIAGITKVDKPTRLLLDSEGNPIVNITKIARGTGYYSDSYYIGVNGELYVTGGYTCGLGEGVTAEELTRMKTDSEGNSICQIADVISFEGAVYYIGVNGELYVSGLNEFRNLGVGGPMYEDFDSNEIEIITRIKKDASGQDLAKIDKIRNTWNSANTILETYLIGENGEVYVAGYNSYGMLGVGGTDSVSVFTRLETDADGVAIAPIEDIVFKGSSAYYIGVNGELYVSGLNDLGQLGLISTDTATNEWFYYEAYPAETKIKRVQVDSNGNTLLPIAEIKGDESSTYYIAKNGSIYASGKLDAQKLGLTTIDVSYKYESKGNVVTPIVNNITLLNNAKRAVMSKEVNIKESEIEIEKVIHCGLYNMFCSTYYIDKNGKVYVSGNNDLGQLGLGHTIDVDLLKELKYDSDGNEVVAIKDILCCEGRVYYIGVNGELYISGYNEFSELGVGNYVNVNTITKITKDRDGNALPKFDRVVSRVTGEYDNEISTFFLGEDGEVYVIGCNSYGQLGLETGETNDYGSEAALSLMKLELDIYEEPIPPMKDIIFTGKSTYFLPKDDSVDTGIVYVSGYNKYGELGNGDSGNNANTFIITPIMVADEEIIKIVATKGDYSSGGSVWYIGKDGGVYANGENYYGQLGLSNKSVDYIYPNRIQTDSLGNDLPEIKDVVSDGSNTYYIGNIEKEGELYVSGRNNYGQLGVTGTNLTKPVRVEKDIDNVKLAKIKEVIIGKDNVYCIGVNGEVYVSGANSYGQLGTGTTTKVSKMTRLTKDADNNNIPQIARIRTNGSSTYYIGKEGELYISGYNSQGQLGTGDNVNVNKLKKISYDVEGKPIGKIADVMLGRSGMYCITENKDIYVTGYNSFGELGLGHSMSICRLTKLKQPDESYSTLGNVTSIYGSETSTVFEEDDGDIFVLGDNTSNKLGTTGTVDVATKINIRNIKDAGIGSNFSVFLKDDGSIVGYGDSSKNGNGLTGIAQIAVGDNKAYFMRSNGTVIDNQGNTIASNAYKIAAGANHLVILYKDGTIETIGQTHSGLLDVVDVFAGKNMTVYITEDGKTYIMQDDVKTELSIKNIVYAELNGEKPYFLTYDRKLIDKDGNTIKALGSELTWVKEIKGNVLLNERMRVYDLNKL